MRSPQHLTTICSMAYYTDYILIMLLQSPSYLSCGYIIGYEVACERPPTAAAMQEEVTVRRCEVGKMAAPAAPEVRQTSQYYLRGCASHHFAGSCELLFIMAMRWTRSTTFVHLTMAIWRCINRQSYYHHGFLVALCSTMHQLNDLSQST